MRTRPQQQMVPQRLEGVTPPWYSRTETASGGSNNRRPPKFSPPGDKGPDDDPWRQALLYYYESMLPSAGMSGGAAAYDHDAIFGSSPEVEVDGDVEDLDRWATDGGA